MFVLKEYFQNQTKEFDKSFSIFGASYIFMRGPCITVALYWEGWRLKSPASRLFAQTFVQCWSKKISKLRVSSLCEWNPPVIHRWPVDSPHKGPVTRSTFPLDDVIISRNNVCTDTIAAMIMKRIHPYESANIFRNGNRNKSLYHPD